MRNQWFGKKPWARICNELEHIATPVGQKCLHCDDEIILGDEGETMGYSDGETASMRPIHRECLLRSVIGSVGHQRGKCSCYGGVEEDPPGLTKREAAIIAAAYFEGRFTAWHVHLGACDTCRMAIRGRFSGMKPHQMAPNCCEIGRPLYRAFLRDHADAGETS